MKKVYEKFVMTSAKTKALNDFIVIFKLKEDDHEEDGDQLFFRATAGNGLTCKTNLS